MLKGRDTFKQGTILNVGDGEDISLWFHHWVGEKPLYERQNIMITDSIAHWRVSYIILNGN